VLFRSLWQTYSEDVPHKLEGKHALTQQSLEYYNRCLLFLGSNLEYEWPDEKGRFFQVAGFGPVIRILTFGLSYFVDKVLEKRAKSFMDKYRHAGDFEVWPFIRKSDYDNERKRQLG